MGQEPEYLKWLVDTLQQVVDKPCAIEKIVTTFAGIHIACGLSNISYGSPARKFT